MPVIVLLAVLAWAIIYVIFGRNPVLKAISWIVIVIVGGLAALFIWLVSLYSQG